MTIKQELIRYANKCIDNKIPSGKKHKYACQRFLNDLKQWEARNAMASHFPYYWDEKEAEKIVKWFAYLRHKKGVLAGKPIILTTWQKFCLCQIYGWREKETGRKRFKKTFIEVARKNAKSQMEAGCVLYEMATQSTKNGEIYECYCAGAIKEQSELIFNECINMLGGSPLKSKFKITNKKIIHRKTGSFLTALSKEARKSGDGTNPAVLILDEYHQHPTTEFYDLGVGANTKEPILMIITTAGKYLNYPCYTEEYTYCAKVVNPNIDVVNESYFVDILEFDNDDDIDNPINWEKANPIRMSYKEGRQKIDEEYQLAKAMPEKMTTFLTKCLNVWVQAAKNGYMDMAKWKQCQIDKIPYDLKHKQVYVGFDLSAKIDLTSVAFIIPVQSNEIDIYDRPVVKYICFSHSFIPNREKMQERILTDKVPYDAWEREGFLTITNTPIVDHSAVLQYVFDVCKQNEWEIEALCFDPANASKAMMDAENEGYTVLEVYQSHKSLNEATAGFREQVYSGNVIYMFNPLLNFAMSNAVVRTNNGLIKIDKDANKNRIDPVDAVLCAFKLAFYHEFINTGSVEDWLNSEW